VRYRLEVPANNGAAAVRNFIETWVDQPALQRIVEAEGGSWPEGTLEERVEALHEFSSHWDFRGGAERLDIEASVAGSDIERIYADAAELGLTLATPPTQPAYDHALVLGGTALASIYRLKHLYELIDAGLVIGQIAVLTAIRDIGDSELDLVRERAEIAPIVAGNPETEFEVMVAAVEYFSGDKAKVERSPSRNPYLESAQGRIVNALVLAAPSGDPERRANTRDNYDVYSSQISPDDSVLIVTSSIYLPYQFFIGLQALGWDRPRTIEAIGFPPEWMQGVLTAPTNVLQELRSALFGARMTLRLLAST
jgi:hypothetical protein